MPCAVSGIQMRTKLIICIMFVASFSWAQQRTREVYAALEGSWVKQSASWAMSANQAVLPEYQHNYLRYEFTPKRALLAYGSYLANGVTVGHELNKRRLKFSFGREFEIEILEADRLVLVELESGKVGPGSVRYDFIREDAHVNALPIDPSELIIKETGDTLFFDSEKFHPVFRARKYPDFHLYVHNQIKRYYPNGENYFHASFEIDERGVIDNIEVYAAANEKSTEKAMRAIKASEGRWKLPKLDGRGVRVLVQYYDRFAKGNEDSQNITAKYADAFVNAHRKAVKHYIKKEYGKALELLELCDDMQPQEHSKEYLKYLIHKAQNDIQLANAQKALLLESPMSFLMN